VLPLFAAVLVAGCAFKPQPPRVAPDFPEQWSGAPAEGIRFPGDDWWTLYQDPALDALVREALVANQDIAFAVARVDEARALVARAQSDLYPSVGAGFAPSRTKFSERTAFPIPPGVPVYRTNYRAAVDAAYEIDLWGRLRAQADAARSDLLATEGASDTVRLTVTGDVVRGYYSLVSLDQQVRVQERALQLRLEGLELQKVRWNAGLITTLDLRRLEAEIDDNRAQLAVLLQRRDAEERALTVLAGRSPRGIVDAQVARNDTIALVPPVVPEGLPSELLLRRPDLFQVEQQLVAANARIFAARAALFPRVTLTGYLGSESAPFSALFSGPAGIWQFAGLVTQPIFQAGRLLADIDLARAREAQLEAQYRKTVQVAFQEVRDALTAQTRAREAYEAETARAGKLREALKLVLVRYENGLISQLDVLDAERNLIQAETNRAEALAAQRSAVADLVKALGGGWTPEALLAAERSRAAQVSWWPLPPRLEGQPTR
jgi:multidrug efflux system outer membrane protein